MASIKFEGKRVKIEEGDSVASALYRNGVRTFTRSVKHHRRRGLYCLSGDCPNCHVTIDDEPGCLACVTPAKDGQVIGRATGWPSTERDLLAVTDRLHRLMPVGFYYKTFVRPRFAWSVAERAIRSATGVGELPLARERVAKTLRHASTELLVIGGGVAGLAAAREAADEGLTVIVCDEGGFGERLRPGAARERVLVLSAELRGSPGVELLEHHAAVGIYAERLVPLAGPAGVVRVDAARVIVATGAHESHPVFPGNDLPGVWLGRGAVRMAAAHRVSPGERAVVATSTDEGVSHISALLDAGVQVVAALVPPELADAVPAGVETIAGGSVSSAQGRKRLERVTVATEGGTARHIDCDALVVSLGYAPRDGLLRMSDDPAVSGAGEVVMPGCSVEEAEASGVAAVSNLVVAEPPEERSFTQTGGYVCLCEDVSVTDLDAAWGEGWHSSEILKRYTTATMGPCQGTLCGRHLASFVAARGVAPESAARTTSRPPAVSVRLEDLAAGVSEVLDKRTSLHDIHIAAGARMDRSGGWMRSYSYGDVRDEYRAVRERVSIMDVGTLGKFLVAGADAERLLDLVFPCRVEGLAPGRSRYVLALDEAGYVFDDGLISALGNGGFYLTSTSGGADNMEAWLRDWADRWDLHVHLVNQTSMLGAINVAGPRSKELLSRLGASDAGAIAYPGHARLDVDGIGCLAIRAGFVGEVAFELHHSRSEGPRLWAALVEAGADLGLAPHGLDALDILRLEKGHIYVGQDAMPDDHPRKLGLGWAVSMDKPVFVGRTSLERMSELPLERRLVGLTFEGTVRRGAPLSAGGRIVGRVTSAAFSPTLSRNIGLGWISGTEDEPPAPLTASGVAAAVVEKPFYDPRGERLRG
jgi:sarcosine oxidase, subunit alpha